MKMSDFMNFIDPTPQQILLIEKQLGRPPRGIRAISCSHDNDVPLVVKMAPLLINNHFPPYFGSVLRTYTRLSVRLSQRVG